jgi:methyltransferase
MVTWYTGLILLVAVARLAELQISARHVRLARARGGIEAGASHYPAMVALHAGFLVACPAEAWLFDRPWIPALGVPMLGLLGGAFAVRGWAIAALGDRWSTRVICVPGDRLVSKGPYRWMRHPNYLAVGVEMFALPLVHTAWLTAVVFSALNALVLRERIRIENAALARYCVPERR